MKVIIKAIWQLTEVEQALIKLVLVILLAIIITLINNYSLFEYLRIYLVFYICCTKKIKGAAT